jgi:hypothetical protein
MPRDPPALRLDQEITGSPLLAPACLTPASQTLSVLSRRLVLDKRK